MDRKQLESTSTSVISVVGIVEGGTSTSVVSTRVNLTGGNRSGLTGYRSNWSGLVPVSAGTQPAKIQNLNLNLKNEKLSKTF